MAVIETMTFALRPDADEQAFLAADRRVQVEFAYHQPGLLRRTTARDSAGSWIVIDLWRSAVDADAMGECWDSVLGASRADGLRRCRDRPGPSVRDAGLTPRPDCRPDSPRDCAAYCWTSISGLPSGSSTTARVGPFGTSKGGVRTAPPRSVTRSRDSDRCRTCT